MVSAFINELNVGNGMKFRIGKDPWLGSVHHQILSGHTIEELRQKGIFFLFQLANPAPRRLWAHNWRRDSTFGLDE